VLTQSRRVLLLLLVPHKRDKEADQDGERQKADGKQHKEEQRQ
jgi:hypothetical protein